MLSTTSRSTTRTRLVARSAVALVTAPMTLVLMSGAAFAEQSAQGAAASAVSKGDAHASEQAAPHAAEAAPGVAEASAVAAAPAVADLTQPQPLSNADQNGTGANPGTTAGCGSYCSTTVGTASANGEGDGTAGGKPCAGCVGKADNKNPKGQASSGSSDHNKGFKCDGNKGIGKGNPAHSTCTPGGGGGGETECPTGTFPTGAEGACEPPPSFGGGHVDLPPSFGSGTVDVPGTLPRTGDSTGVLGLAALGLLMSGSGLVVAARRRTT
jgi:LPXTG-motif cell wall-anchored protein